MFVFCCEAPELAEGAGKVVEAAEEVLFPRYYLFICLIVYA